MVQTVGILCSFKTVKIVSCRLESSVTNSVPKPNVVEKETFFKKWYRFVSTRLASGKIRSRTSRVLVALLSAFPRWKVRDIFGGKMLARVDAAWTLTLLQQTYLFVWQNRPEVVAFQTSLVLPLIVCCYSDFFVFKRHTLCVHHDTPPYLREQQKAF